MEKNHVGDLADWDLSSSTLALSPLDGRYMQKVKDLCPFFSEYGLIHHRVLVEVKWLLKLSEIPEITEVPQFSADAKYFLERIIRDFDINDALEVKKIEKITNHDVKAVEYYLKQRCKSYTEIANVLEFFHFACTSEDINNLAHALSLKEAMSSVMFPVMVDLCEAICVMAKENAHIPMLSRTHGQPASPTTLGKEMANFAVRLSEQGKAFPKIQILGKFAGAVGNYNAHKVAYPDINWPKVAAEFIRSLGVEFNAYVTQVDLRILKAVAIEHANDVDAAAEFILLDVLPSIIGSCEASSTLHNTDEMEHSSTAVGKGKQPILAGHQEVEEETTSHLSGQEPVTCEITVSNGYTSSHVMSPCIGEADPRDLQVGVADYSKGSEHPTLHYNASKELNTTPDSEQNFMEKGIDLNSDVEDIVLHPKAHVHEKFMDVALCNMNDLVKVGLVSSSSAHDECLLEQPVAQSCIGKLETVINVLHDRSQKLDELCPSVAASFVNSDVENVPLEPFETNSDSMENRKIMKGGSYSVHGSEEQSGCSVQPANARDLYELEVDTVSAAGTFAEDIKVCGEAADSWGCGMDEVTTATSEYKEPHSKLVDESVADMLSFESGMLSANDNNLPATLVTRSGHFVTIEYLEDLISDAKSSKKIFLSAMELTTNMMREVELLEERSKQAKEAASDAGQDILSKVEELKKILKHVKEANDMHAGEVYGEKAILATEARELQSRLLSLSDERNRSLSMIEKIHRTLEARLAAMEEEIAAAEQEKLEKEAVARKALSEQEAIMASVVEESKKLQQAAEENSKLREFLMDRGRIVDALQGEIAVICEDVMLLKEIVDGRVPLSRSLLSSSSRSLRSTASSLIASSSSSYHRTKHSSNDVPEHEDFTEKPVVAEQEQHEVQQPVAEQEQHEVQQPEKSNLSGDIHGTSTDDGWELLKDGVLCS